MKGILFSEDQLLILVVLALCLVVIQWTQRNKSARDDGTLGLGRGIVALLGQWFGVTAFLASSEAAYDYGVIGLISYSLAGSLSFLLCYLAIKRFRLAGELPLMERIERVFSGKSLGLVKVLLAFVWLEEVLIVILAGKIILHLLYGWSTIVSSISMTLFFLLMMFFRYGNFHQASFVIALLATASTVLIPTLVYLDVSVPTVYSGVKFLATDMLELTKTAGWYLAIALFIRFVTHTLLNERVWTIYHQIKPSKRGLSFSLSPLIWAFLPLSMGTLSFVAKAEAVWPIVHDEVSILIVARFGGEFGIVLFTVTLIVILLAIISRYTVDGTEQKTVARLVAKGLIILTAGSIALLLPELTILQTMLVFTLVWAALAPVVLLARKSLVHRTFAVLVIFISAGYGVYHSVYTGIAYGVLIDFAISLGIMTLLTIFTNHPKGGGLVE